jgi:hypothetical protein
MTGLPFKNVSWVKKLQMLSNKIAPPAIYVGELVLPSQGAPLDTYIDLTGWGKVSEDFGTEKRQVCRN